MHLGKSRRCEILLAAKDRDKRSALLNLTVLSVPVEVNLKINTGDMKLLLFFKIDFR